MYIQHHTHFSDMKFKIAVLGSCSCCGTEISFGEMYQSMVDGSYRCRLCKPSLPEQLADVLDALDDVSSDVWKSDDQIVDAIVDAKALYELLPNSKSLDLPRSVDLLNHLKIRACPFEKRAAINNVINRLKSACWPI